MLSFRSLGTNHDELFLGFCRTVRCLGLRVGAIWPLGRGEQMWELRRFRAYRWSAWIEGQENICAQDGLHPRGLHFPEGNS